MSESERKVSLPRATPGRLAILLGLLVIAIVAVFAFLTDTPPREEAVDVPVVMVHKPGLEAPLPPAEPDSPAEEEDDLVTAKLADELAADRDWEGLLDLLRKGHARAVCPALLKGIESEDEEVQFTSTHLMIWVGDVARPHVPQILTNIDYTESCRSAWQTTLALESVGAPRAEDIPAIVELMLTATNHEKTHRRRPECYRRVECAHALARLGDEAAHTVPKFAVLLEHSDLYANRMAVRALVDMGRAGVSGIPMILAHKSGRMTGGVYNVYSGIAAFGEAAVPYLVEALRRADTHVCTVALYQIRRSGSSAQKAVPALLELYRSPGRQDRRTILSALAATGTRDREALELVEREMQSAPDASIRHSAAKAFVALADGHEKAKALPLLLPQMKDRKKKYYAVQTIGDIGPGALDALPTIENLMRDDYKREAMRAALAYWKITGDAAAALKVIDRFFDDPKWPDSVVAFEVLEAMGRAARPAVRRLDEILAREDRDFNVKAAMVRYRATGDPAPTVEALAGVVESYPSREYRKRAAIALAEIGPDAKTAVPALVRALAWENMLYEGVHCIRAVRSILGPDSFPSDVVRHAVLPKNEKAWKRKTRAVPAGRRERTVPTEHVPVDEENDVF